MIVVICGGRAFTDGPGLFRAMDRIHAARPISLLVEGGQRTFRFKKTVGGADYWANQWGRARGVPVRTVAADWGDLSHPDAAIRVRPDGSRYDAMAGMRRNRRMLEDFDVDAVIAFPGGAGTRDMKQRALAAGVEVIEP